MKHKFRVLTTNYRTRFGEIDIVAEKDKKIHFVEVKTIKVRGVGQIPYIPVRPEDNLTSRKYSHLAVSVEWYLKNNAVTRETPHQIDLACVYLDTEKREGQVTLMENIHKG